MPKVSAVVFAFLSPNALRSILSSKGYRVSIYDGTVESLHLRSDDVEHNIVVLPNFKNRYGLAEYSNLIHRVLVLADGQHHSMVNAGLEVVDSQLGLDGIKWTESHTPNQYVGFIETKSNDLDVTPVVRAKPKKREKKPSIPQPQSLDAWLDYLNELDMDADFDKEIEQPVCSFLMSELGYKELKQQLRDVAKRNTAYGEQILTFFRFVTGEYGRSIALAVSSLAEEGVDTDLDLDVAQDKDVQLVLMVVNDLEKNDE